MNFTRSCPPMELANSLVLGQVLEVFYDFSWKMATISKLLNRIFFDCHIGWIIRGTERKRVISGLGSVGRKVLGITESKF